MKTYASIVIFVALLAGCASTKVSDSYNVDTGQLARPSHIWVYDFAATGSDVPGGSALYGKHSEHNSPQTAQQLATGRQVGAEIATDLVAQISAMGLPAKHASSSTTPAVHDIVIHGYIIAIVQGDKDKRVAIGLGEGSSELKAAAEGFEMTANGLVKWGGGKTDATGDKTPGAGVGLVGMVATHNPLGLIVSSGVKVHGEKTGEATISGRAKQTATEIAGQIKKQFQQEGWIN
jgi:hypothetical protein